jgi:hypothetical protein
MRTIEIDTHKYEIRALKRKEVKQLRKNGYILTALDPQTAEDAMDQVFQLVFSPEQISQIDERPNPDALKLWSGILKETYGAPDEEKN